MSTDGIVEYSTRQATLADIETLVQIGKETFTDTFAADNTAENIKSYVDKNFTVEQQRKELEDPRSTFILLYDREDVAGYAKLRKAEVESNGDKKLEIERIYARKGYIGKKAGKALMQACLDIARREHYNKVWLGVWEHNARAISFYERWGFKTVGAHPFQLGEDTQTDLIMEKELHERESTSL